MPEAEFLYCNLDTLIKERPEISAIVSPANSYGIMNGGIDNILHIERSVKNMIELKGDVDNGFRRYLPVDRCKVVQCDHDTIKYLFVMPTMKNPRKIHDGDKYTMVI